MLLKRCSWIELQKMLLQEKMNMPSLFYHQQGCLKKGQLTNLIFQDLTPFACFLLKQFDFNDQVDLKIEKEGIVIKPVKSKTREGWDNAFKLMHDRKEDTLLIDEKTN